MSEVREIGERAARRVDEIDALESRVEELEGGLGWIVGVQTSDRPSSLKRQLILEKCRALLKDGSDRDKGKENG